MFVVHVSVHVKADQIEAFKKATLENAHNSMQEPGIAARVNGVRSFIIMF